MRPLAGAALVAVALVVLAPLGAVADGADAVDVVDVRAALATFKAAMKSGDPGSRKAAVAAVSATKDKKIAQALVRYARDRDAGVRAAVCRAMGRQGNARVVAKLFKLLEIEKEPAVLVAICDGIGQAPSAKAVEPLSDMAKNLLNVCEQADVAKAAIRALGEIRHASAVEELIDLCQRTDRRTWVGPGPPSILSPESKAWLEGMRPDTFAALAKLTGQSYPTPRIWSRWWRESRRGYKVADGPEDLTRVDRYQDNGYLFRMSRPDAGWNWSRPSGDSAIIQLARPGSDGEGPPAVKIVVAAYEDDQSAEQRARYWDDWAREHLSDVTDRIARGIPFGGERGAREWSATGRSGRRVVTERRFIIRRGDLLFEILVTLDAGAPERLKEQTKKVLRSFTFQ